MATTKTFATPEQFEVDDRPADDPEDDVSRRGGRRKFGVLLTGAALGGIASTFWTYGQLKRQQVTFTRKRVFLNIGSY
jgi:hypothetical protein